MSLQLQNEALLAAKPYYGAFVPGPSSLIAGLPGRIAGYIFLAYKAGKSLYKIQDAIREYHGGKRASFIAGDILGTVAIYGLCKPVKSRVKRNMAKVSRTRHDPFRKNGIGGRYWYSEPGRHKMVIVFHDANRAGPHIDVHIGRMSLVYRVKPELYAQLKYNREGFLTESSRALILDHIRQETANRSRVPQNLDHSKANARSWWVGGDPQAFHYGAGRTRQLVLETDVEIYKAGIGRPIEMYAPAINPHRSLYMHRLYDGSDKRAPILIWGVKKAAPPTLNDRLHLKLTHPEEIERLEVKADMSTSTAKYDGSSAYIVITPKGTTAWSPRTSVRTGEQIEYTFKLNGLPNTYSPETIVAMGEVLFVKDGRYLPASSGGGILNSNLLVPKGVRPEIRLYRVDKIGRKSTVDLPFWENRALQQAVAQLNPEVLKVVELMDPEKACEKGFEGFVVVPPDASVNDGFKVKWWDNPSDWRIDEVALTVGPKGGIAGVVHTTSLESGRRFKLGPGQMGDHDLAREMMANPDDYIGTVIRVNSKIGHEGRASKVVGFHDDKGFAPV
jgi:hypothetical protein